MNSIPTMKWIRKPVKENHTHEPADASRPHPPNRSSVECIVARIRRYNSDVDPTSDAFRAAVLLLVALEYGQNIDALARRTGYDRAFVARCARRLIDNGVWQNGRTIAEWSSADEASGSFWNDVAVAEGKMCRRAADDGSIEWAPAGYWNKGFQYTDEDSPDRMNNVYHNAGTRPSQPAEDQPAAAEAAEDSAEEPIGPDTRIGGQPVPPAGEKKDDDESVPPLDRLFRDAIWIG